MASANVNLSMNVAGVAFVVFAVATQFVPNVLKGVKFPVVREMNDMLANNRKGFVYNSLVVGLVAGLSTYLAMRFCASNEVCLGNLAKMIPNRVPMMNVAPNMA
jgi:hypothetical protein